MFCSANYIQKETEREEKSMTLHLYNAFEKLEAGLEMKLFILWMGMLVSQSTTLVQT